MANENQQFEILTEVLERFHEKGILDRLTLIGSWCIYFYNIHFKEKVSSSELRTRDSDFLVSKYEKFPQKVDIPALLEDLGFIVELRGQNGFMTLQHPELFVEFLVPETGSETDKPFTIPSLSVKANKLNHLQMLLRDPITVKYHHLNIRVPNPADFAIHKLIISEIRKNKDKRKKDFLQGSDIYRYLISNGDQESIDKSIEHLTTKEKKYFNRALEKFTK